MSNFSTVQDLLLHNQQLHGRITEFYRELALKASCEQVKILLHLLAQHENKLMTSLGEYIAKAPANVLNTFYQFDRQQNVEKLFITQAQPNQMSSDEVDIIAQRIDEYFSQLYQQMVAAVECDGVKDLFESLHQHMEEEKKRLSTDINSLQDM